jgi:hypothetical protein
MPFDGTLYETEIRAFDKIDQVIEMLASSNRWCKGSLRTLNGRRCILGALQDADASSLLRLPILAAIYEVTGIRYESIERFNDARWTTHPLVLQVLTRARENIANGLGVTVVPAPRKLRMRIQHLFA